MPRLLALAFTGLAALSCAKQQTTPQTANLATEQFSDDSGDMQVKLGYVPQGGSIEIVIELKPVGTEEMDKLFVEITANGFVVAGGEPQWTGFVQPMTKHTQRVTLKADEGAEFGTVEVTVSRSVDSHVLMQHELPFQVAGGKVVPDT